MLGDGGRSDIDADQQPVPIRMNRKKPEGDGE